MEYKRIVCWFSAGVTSTVATKLALDKYRGSLPVDIVYTDTGSEHPDTKRYISDCENLFGQNVIILKSKKYRDIWDVFEKTRYLVGIAGARCTTELKKVLRFEYQKKDDLQIFGFDLTEEDRADRIKKNNFDCNFAFPLIETNTTKKDCIYTVVHEYKIKLPEMYKLGYNNNNCIPCVKGGAGYYAKIRKDFPEQFKKMAEIERKLDISILRDKNGERLFLDRLPAKIGTHNPIVESCGLFCGE